MTDIPSKDNGGKESSPKPSPDHQAKTLPSTFFGGSKFRKFDTTAASSATEDASAKLKSAFRIDDYIPKDQVALRETSLYRSTYRLIQWQRDNYLTGQEYANWRKTERQKNPDEKTRDRSIESFEIPYDATALGHDQLAHIASGFIPSETVVKALVPLVAELPGGALYEPTKNAMISLIWGQQTNLDNILKNTILTYLRNPENRVAIKASTQGYIATTYRDSDDE